MTFKIKALIATAVFAASGAAFAQTTLLIGSYVVAREFYKDYKAQFSMLPYPPVFVTGDAVVTCAGHLLVVERGGMPGKGL